MDLAFRQQVYDMVKSIPKGKLMTYGQIAALCGRPQSAWQVGQIAHFGSENLPWHRVVNKQGGLARGWPTGINTQKILLEQEGVKVKDYVVDIKTLQWSPQ